MEYEMEMEDETGGDEEAGNEEDLCATETNKARLRSAQSDSEGSENSSTS